MNLGIITSYIIGGIILLSILMMNLSVSNSSIEITMRQANQQKLSSITDMISSDLQKMGYNLEEKTETILVEADHDRLKFQSNIDNSGDIETVSWEFTDEEVTSTDNPDDLVLRRIVRDKDTNNITEETPIRLGVTDFNISYYTSYGADRSDSLSTPLSTSEMEDVRQLYIKINLESAEKISGSSNNEGEYMRSVWEKRFSPPNLEITIQE